MRHFVFTRRSVRSKFCRCFSHSDTLTDRPSNYVIARVGQEQRLELRHAHRLLAELSCPGLRLQHDSRPAVKLGAEFIGRHGHDREAAHAFALG